MNLTKIRIKTIRFHIFLFLFFFISVSIAQAGYFQFDPDEEPEFHSAVIKGNTAKVRDMLSRSPDLVNSLSKDGFPPLIPAIDKNHPDIVKLLISKGAKIDGLNKEKMTPLQLACERGNLEIVKLLIDKGADIEIKGSDGWTPLFYSIYGGNLKVIEYLIDKGADVYAENTSHQRPIDYVSDSSYYSYNKNRYGTLRLFLSKGIDLNKHSPTNTKPILEAARWADDHESTALLLHYGADIHARNENGKHPLISFASSSDLATIKYLLEAGIDPNITDDFGNTPTLEAADNNNPEIIKLFVKYGGDIHAVNDSGETALYKAIIKGNTEVAEYLIDKGLDINNRDRSGLTPLHFAAMNGSLDIVKLLVEKGADVNALDHNGNSPIMNACLIVCRNHLKVIKYLASKGADLNKVNNNGETILTFSSGFPCNESHEITKYLFSQNLNFERRTAYNYSPIDNIASLGEPRTIRFLTSKGVKINPQTEPNLLHWASYNDNSDMAAFLILQGYDVNKKDAKGNTPLHRNIDFHITIRSSKTIKLLTDYGADVNAVNNKGKTPLHMASQDISSSTLIIPLLDAGADPNVKDKSGNTAVHYFAKEGLTSLIDDYSNKCRFDLNVKNNQNKSPLDIAADKQDEEMMKALITHGADVDLKHIAHFAGKKDWKMIDFAFNHSITLWLKTIIPIFLLIVFIVIRILKRKPGKVKAGK